MAGRLTTEKSRKETTHDTKNLKTLALGAAIAGSLAAMSTAQANPFAVTALASAYIAGDGDTKGTEASVARASAAPA